MYDFSFCVPSSENPAKNGTSKRVCHSTGSPQWALFPQALVRDDFVWIQLTERHTSKQKAEQWIFSWGGMKAWSHGWDLWTGTYQIPHVVREPQEHTHPSTDASFTYHTVSLTPNQRSQIQSISQAVWGQVQVQEYFTKQDIYYNLLFSSTHPGQGLVPSLPSLIQAWDCNHSRL